MRAKLIAEALLLTLAHACGGGRARFRSDALRGRRDLVATLREGAALAQGVRSVELRPTTGSVIVRFEPSVTTPAAVAAALEALVRGPTNGRAPVGTDETGPSARFGRSSAAPAARANGAGRTMAPTPSDHDGAPPWHALGKEETLARLASDAIRGLRADEAAERLRRHGPNRPPDRAQQSSIALFARQFEGLPVAMLGASAALSLATGGVADALATLSVVVVNGVIGFVVEGQAERRIQALMDASQLTVETVRDGAALQLRADLLAPGDVIALGPGRPIPADARLLSSRRLSVDEAALTGESLPVAKDPDARIGPNAPIGARATMVYAGALVAEGEGRAVVVETGARTQAAQIQALSGPGARPQAAVEAELDALGAKLAAASLIACGAFLGIGVLRGYAMRAMLKDALALAVAAVPEGLPMVATSTLSRGIHRMERRGILIRQINAVQTLGAVQTLCLDKTGTLTENRMAVCAALAGTRPLELPEPAKSAPGDLPVLRALAEAAALNNDGGLEPDAAAASPTERALLEFAAAMGVDVAALRAQSPRRKTLERGPGRPWMSTLHKGRSPLLFVKGAPEAVLGMCDAVWDGGAARPITATDRARILAENDRLAARPARVLGFARSARPQAARTPISERPSGLVWLGLLAMIDPIRPAAPAFIAAMHRAGVETVLITGDQAATATATARALNLSNGAPLKLIDSSDLTALSPDLLAGLARDAHVFARVSGQQKRAIVQALQAAGRVVAMTGDGVNDAPALAAADLGVAMGAGGADLARDVANVVIRDDELGTLVEAMAQGRSIHRNIRRSLEFLISTNISEIAVSLVEALHGPGELETPMELLWINLVTDVLPGLGLAQARPEPDAMSRPPRPAEAAIIPPEDFRRMALDSSVIAAASLTSHFVGLARHGPGPETRGMTFLTLSIGQLLYTLVCQRRDARKLRLDALLENRPLDLALLVSSGLAVLPFFQPTLRRLLGVAPLGRADAAVALAAAAIPFASVLARRGFDVALFDADPERTRDGDAVGAARRVIEACGREAE